MKLSKFIEKAGNYVFLRIRDTDNNILSEGCAREFDIKRLKGNDAKVVGFYPTCIKDHEYTKTIINVTIKSKEKKKEKE